MSDLKSYLAEKYMSGPKADAILAKTASQTKKKRKKGTASTSTSAAGGGVMLVDEDAGWPSKDRGRGGDDDDEDALKEAVVASDRGFKKRKVGKEGDSTWVTVQEGLAGSSSGVKEEEEEPTPLDEQPTVVETPFVGGLVTAKQLKKVVPQRTVQKDEGFTAEDIARAQETVYRDSSGRKVDMKAAKAEAARLKREREEKEAQKMEWGKGLVQRDEKEERRKEMEKNRSRKFARGVDDADLNEELKSKELWNDPAAAFLSKNKKKGPRKPEYSGPPPPPNRFGIKPGYRWDGVDRGNGFEKKLFQSVNARKRKGAESYAWGAEDM
ncbi:pre-mRNA-splicing factor CWC26 [Ephemerocybe angulata]|uniref:Pre-mRNA-splicing factor CWC26 n=1 Tax=Ephemerocybe angulata TaxID=980116 RepID=A0A8H6HYB3_9AGAR|nr:pre-mRNA-splicing factor CWC26 [Tulosesus angulatus]